jgi:hypothetical protein
VDHGISVEVFDGGHDALLEFLFGSDTDMAQDGARELGKEALDQIEPRAMGRRALGLVGAGKQLVRRRRSSAQRHRCILLSVHVASFMNLIRLDRRVWASKVRRTEVVPLV